MKGDFPCDHFLAIRDVKPSSLEGCEECLRVGSPWVHLRVCLTCGHVGCCDDSPLRHATAHFHGTGHPVIKSFEPGETWGWCYADEAACDPVPGPSTRRHIAPPKAR
ncbi:MAG TPA: UBP-type zinc finger domain-containing protein [Usitatibacter sp.]